jgi:hypothetical protein
MLPFSSVLCRADAPSAEDASAAAAGALPVAEAESPTADTAL